MGIRNSKMKIESALSRQIKTRKIKFYKRNNGHIHLKFRLKIGIQIGK